MDGAGSPVAGPQLVRGPARLAVGQAPSSAPGGGGFRHSDGGTDAFGQSGQTKSGLCTTLSTTAAPPSLARFESHHTAPLRTDQ